MLTTPEEFAKQDFCKCRRFCNRCRNHRSIRVAILKNHGIEHDGKGCPLNLPWGAKPESLPAEARWECVGTPEHAHWLVHDKPQLDLLADDLEFERKHGRAALLDLRIRESRAQDYEKEEARALAGLEPNRCPLKETTSCGCSGGGWIVCHFPGYKQSGATNSSEYVPQWLGLPAAARGEVSEEFVKRLASTPGALERARFRVALDDACRKHGGCMPEHKDDCNACWDHGAKGLRA